MLETLFENNKKWAAKMLKRDPHFFEGLQKQQTPEYFWIGCSDSRVPANDILNLQPGEVFVQRNVANQVVHSDMNCLTALQFAVDVLKVKHVIVCGHYSCGGVQAALGRERHGLVDNWLLHVRDTMDKHEAALSKIDNEHDKLDRLCEINVVEQVKNICNTMTIEDAWGRGQEVLVHGLLYSIKDGHLRDLELTITNSAEKEANYLKAVNKVFSK
ncbi:carbonate dehydratase [Leucothrix sargassi]|nr:carbonate dehydratase [Leucothrix sargassi]